MDALTLASSLCVAAAHAAPLLALAAAAIARARALPSTR